MYKHIFFYTILNVTLFSCTHETEKNSVPQQSAVIEKAVDTTATAAFVPRAITPPIDDVKPQAEIKTVQAGKGDTLLFSTGSIVIVPANALADQNGKAVSGACQVVFEEYLDPAAILLSGIPMVTEENGKSYPFTSAGMFTIHATSGGKALTIASGKMIEVKQATSDQKGSYDFFKFNEVEKHWEKTGKTDPEKNTMSKEIAPMQDHKPVKPVLKNDKSFTFDMNINTEDFPEFKSMQNIVWQSAKEKGFPDAEKDQDKIFSTLWYNIELKPYKKDQSKYILQLSNDKESYRTVIIPTLEQKEYDKAMENFKTNMKEYEANKTTEIQKRETQRIGAEIVRTMQLSAFGIYNHDVICRMGGTPVVCKALFKKNKDVFFTPAKAFLISKTSNTIIQYGINGYDTYENFSYDPNDKYGILTLDTKGNVGVVSVKEFESAKQNKAESSFTVAPYAGKISSADDLRKILLKM